MFILHWEAYWVSNYQILNKNMPHNLNKIQKCIMYIPWRQIKEGQKDKNINEDKKVEIDWWNEFVINVIFILR